MTESAYERMQRRNRNMARTDADLEPAPVAQHNQVARQVPQDDKAAMKAQAEAAWAGEER